MESRITRLESLVGFSTEKITKLEQQLGSLSLIVQIEAKVTNHERTLSDHELRMREIERANVKLAAYVGVMATVGSTAAQILVRLIYGA